MSGVINAVIGVVEIIVGVYADSPGLIAAGVATLLGYAASLLQNPHRNPLLPIGASYAGTLEPRRIIYGTLRVSGMYTTPPLTHGNNNDVLDIVLTVAGHPVDGFGDMYFNQIRISMNDIGPILGTLSDGQVTNLYTNNGYEGLAWIRRYDGTQTTPDFIMFEEYAAWDANHVGKQLAYWAISLAYNTVAFATGVPQISGLVRGKRVYDPRQDSTNGGSGSQRAATPSTWTYSTNPALCLRDYLTSPLGLGEAQTRIDDVLVSVAASICDQLVSVPIPLVPGLTQWTAGETIVAGIGTAFLRDLNFGSFTQSGSNFFPSNPIWILGPDNVMYQIASVQSDIELTLAVAFAGATKNDAVSQWNTSAGTTITQARYTCNTMLDCTARFEDNVATLSRAMMGQCIYSAGKWRMYAGAWTGAAFNLTERDLVGGVSIQCSTPRQNLYNAVRGNFINPARNYQPDEFPPILNSTFSTEDGETIFTETNFPCCTDIFEAQRNAIIVSRVSRDQKVITAECGMSAYAIKVFQTGTITIAEAGLIDQTVRCIGWKFTPKGSIQLQLQEAYSNDWLDPLVTDYAIKGANSTGSSDLYIPFPATGLTATGIAGGINFKVTLPLQSLPGTKVQLFESTSPAPFTSSVLIAEQAANSIFIPKFDTITRWYWVRTLSPQEQVSTAFPPPPAQGIPGAALSASTSLDPVGNLLDVNAWAIGTIGSQGNYLQFLQNAPGLNTIILGDGSSLTSPLGPYQNTEAIWKAVGGSSGLGSNGWQNTADLQGVIDSTKSYRCSVWVRYTGPTTGSTDLYFGCEGGASITNLSPGAVDANPYFAYCDMSALTADKWYLFVGVIHGSSYSGAQSGVSGIYDPATGDRVQSGVNGFSNAANVSLGADFKFTPGALGTEIRAFNFDTSSTATISFYARPRFEQMNGQEPQIRDLLYPGVVDPSFSPGNPPVHVARHGILARGNVVPVVQGATFTYTSTTSSIQWTWTGYQVFRADGTSFNMIAGNQNVTGLSASMSYTSYAYSLETAPSTMGFATSSVATGTPQMAFPPSATYLQLAAAQAGVSVLGNIFQGKLTGATPASGTGGGGGGGGGFGCPHPDQLVLTSAGPIRASRLEVGDELLTPDGWSPIVKLQRIKHYDWYFVEFDNRERLNVTGDHRFVAPDLEQVRASELRIGEILKGRGAQHRRVMAIRMREMEEQCVSIELADPHLYFLTAEGPLSHNLKP